jgi:hypothetical protein
MSKPKMSMRDVFATVPREDPPQAVEATANPANDQRAAPPRKSHGDKKPVLIHIPPDMHKRLKRVALEDDDTLAGITERLLRKYLADKGYTEFALASKRA